MVQESASRRLRQLRAILATASLGAAVGLIGLLVVTAIRNRGRLPELTPDAFYAAKAQWESEGLENYNVTVAVTGRQAATYHVEVRGGEVQVATRNGLPLRQRRTQGTWSVPGMFNTMQSDVDHLEKQIAGTTDAQTPRLLLRAVFDPERGYPQRYHRTELRRFGNNIDVSWEVTTFERVESPESSVERPESNKEVSNSL